MLSLFAIPKHFQGKTEVIQRNAVVSWTYLKPRPEIILFGDEEGTARLADELDLLHIPEVARSRYGTPLVDDLFDKARRISRSEILCYLNADIILLDDFSEAVDRILFQEFMMTGRRLDLELDKPLEFDTDDWQERLREDAVKYGKLHGQTGIDYFVFSRGLYRQIPPFAVGRTAWDNWLIYKARALNVPVVDATPVVRAIHQEHDYSHRAESGDWVLKGPEARSNLELAGGWSRVFTLEDASLVLTPEGLKKPGLTRKRFYRRLETIQVLRPRFAFWARLARVLLEPGRFFSAIKKRMKQFFQSSR